MSRDIKKLKRNVNILLILGLMVLTGASASSTDGVDPGAEHLVLFGGARGKVKFPHRIHQEVLDDCNVCHALFPRVREGIQKLKAEKMLENRQVMNKLCVNCHRKRKTEGLKSGPTTCSKCHG